MGKLKLVILFFFLLNAAFAQNIRLLSVDEGLPQSFVSGIVEDKSGFVWISTRNGLARYDGHQFKVFQHVPNQENTLASNFIDYIKKGKGNLLYVRHDSGEIDIFNTATEEVTHFLTKCMIDTEGVNTSKDNWHIDSDNNLWNVESSRNLVKYTFANSSEAESKEYLFESERIIDFTEDEDGILWMLTNCCIVSYNRENEVFTETAFELPLSSVKNEQIKAVFHHRLNGEIMWATKERIYFFNKMSSSFRYVDLPEVSQYNIKWISGTSDGKVFFELNSNIYSYDDVLGLQFRAKINVGEYREIQTFLVDASGLIWVGTNSEGVFLIDLTMNFESFVYEEDFTIDILKNRFNLKSEEIFGMEIGQRTGLSPSYYLRSNRTQQGIWLALNRNVGFYDFNKETLEMLPELEPVSDFDSFAPIKGISLTQENFPLVIDQSNNIYFFDFQSNEWKKSVVNRALIRSELGQSIPNDMILSDNKLWITTESDGLLRIDILNNTFLKIDRDFGLPTNTLFGIVQDITDTDVIWVGSSQGLIRINKSTLETKTFSVAEGLPDNVIYSILPDQAGYLWLGTNKGLTRFHTTNFSQRTFTKSHGLPNIEFNRFHSIELPNGDFAFGGISRGVMFNPKFIKEDTFEPKIAITKIMVNNSVNDEIIANSQYNTLKKIELPYDKNTLSFEFAALQFSQPDDINYRYRLKGYDKEWVYIDKKREAVYTKIPPGEYTLDINSTNTSGIWSPHQKSITIKISPPFWKTWWARATYILILVLIVYFFARYSIDQKVIKKEIALKDKEAEHLRQMDEIKTNFFSNITHELRTPLSLIIGPAELLLNGNEDREKEKKLVSIIYKNADNLLKLTNQLLDIAKLEAGVLKPQLLWGDLVLVVSKMVKSFSQEAADRQIQIQFKAPPTAEYLFSPNTLERIVSNLISNALKFSPPNSKIEIQLNCHAEGITLEVIDQGKGIPKKELSNIFKRFYKVDTNGSQPGTGIGLSLVHELVEIHKGFITVESSETPPVGTKFTVFLPFEKREEKESVMIKNASDDFKEPLQTNGKPLILVVEDNEELASFLSLSLQKSYQVLLARDGSEALKIAAENLPDIIISDVLMEGMDGFEFCEALKKDINLSHIPTILLTAKSDMGSKLKGLSMGADDYITKPFNISELIMRIENKLELQTYQRNFFYRKFKLLPMHPDSYLLDKEHVNNDFLEKIQKIIDEQMEDEKFGVEELASTLNMSRTSLHRKVKSITNLSCGEVIKAYKLKKAIEYLHQGLTISEVAYKTGFASPSYFSKCFKETYNLTPSEYLHKQELQPNS